MRLGRWALALALAFAGRAVAQPGPAEPFDLEPIPDALRPWIGWVESAGGENDCPPLARTEVVRCVWAGPLSLDVGASAARFTQRVEVFGAGAWVTLPGDASLRPQAVRANGQPVAVVVFEESSPRVWLARGRHEIDGSLLFETRPATLPIPAATALVDLTLDGVAVPVPVRDAGGQLWLEARAAEPAPEDALDVQVFRRLVDEVPLELETRLLLRAAGRPREVVLGPVQPDGFVLLALDAELPARMESDGRLRVQLRPGAYTVTVRARHDGPVERMAPPAGGAEGWPAEEVWVFEARPALRIVAVEGVSAIDPNQTELPYTWRQLPAYVVRPGEALVLSERRRGDPDPSDDLKLVRTWWLDFDGGGVTFRDVIEGRLRKTSRLEMPEPSQLGRVALGGRDWFLTRLGDAGAVGVEAPPGDLSLEAEGRIEAVDTGALPAVGWSHDFDAAGASLNLPPGWAVLHVFGADRATPTWVGSWTLLDFFLVLVTAAAAGQLFGVPMGLLALVALVLTWIEPGAPALVWIATLAGEALVRVLRGRGRRLEIASRALRGVAWLALVLHVVPYAVDELRRGLHLAYAPPYASPLAGTLGRMMPAAAPPGRDAAEVDLNEMELSQLRALGYTAGSEEAIAVPSAPPVAPERAMDAKEAGALARIDSAPIRPPDLRALDPDARIPTGPGVPDWQWIRVQLGWSGPVDAEQTLRLLLVSPFWNRVFSFARVLLLAALVAVLVRRAARAAPAAPPGAVVAALAAALLAAGALAPPRAQAEFPPPELLDQLRQRVDRDPACHPSCASVARLALELRDERLRLRVEAHAAVATAIPLPSGAPETEGFGVESVLVDARPTEALFRADDGALWLLLEPGVHDVLLDARVAPQAQRVDLELPMSPGRVGVDAPGWSVEGLDAQGLAAGAISLRRASAPGAAAAASLAAAPPPFFASVQRMLSIDVAWSIETRVERLSAPGQAAVIEVPLLDGEALATEGIPVQDGKARVAFSTDTSVVVWSSTLAPRETLVLAAPKGAPWVETWHLSVQPIWHVEAEGIPPMAVLGGHVSPLRGWRPWPGETLTLRAQRPKGIGGATLTIDRAGVRVAPGRRSRDVALELSLRSTQGGRHSLVLPEGAALRVVRIDGVEQPLRADGRELSLPIRPGAQTAQLEWRSDEPIGWRVATPEVAFGAPVVNLSALLAMPEDRWILAVGGPRLGPSVLFWSALFVVALVAYGLSRVRAVPLRFHDWLLLGVGLTQVPVWMGAVVAGWLLALAWRRARGASLAPPAFDALQVALAAGTLVALGVLFAAIRQGLLGAPEMQIAGNGSSARELFWYQDRSAGELPAASVFSVPLFVYRAAMLAWALWLAFALLRWLRWGWASLSEGGLWRPLRRSPSSAPPGKISS